MPDSVTTSSGPNKRQRLDTRTDLPPVGDNAFIQDNDAADSAGDDDDDDEGRGKDKKAGRRKIKIEFIQDKSRRHITFSKRKAGIMKKAYELSTLTGTQVLLLVVSETGLVYTFTTAKLQPLVTQPEGKNLIQACLNAPHGQLPSQMPVGTPLGRSSGPVAMATPSQAGKDEEGDREEEPTVGTKRRRRGSTAGQSAAAASNAQPTNAQRSSPHSPSSQLQPNPTMNVPRGSGGQLGMGGSPPQAHAHPQHPHQQPGAYPGFPGGVPPEYGGQPPMLPPGSYYNGPPQGGPPQNMPGGPQAWAGVQQQHGYGRR